MPVPNGRRCLGALSRNEKREVECVVNPLFLPEGRFHCENHIRLSMQHFKMCLKWIKDALQNADVHGVYGILARFHDVEGSVLRIGDSPSLS